MRSQPMTASYHQGTLKNVLLDVQKLAQKLIDRGFEVTRIKIEAMVNNHDVPIADGEVQLHPSTNYFEFHIKVTLPANFNLETLRIFCWKYNAHLSTNACKQKVNGQQQRFITMRLYGVGRCSARFITMRLYGVGRCSAQASFDALLTALKGEGLKLSQPQKEYTVYDSNLNLDRGWFSTNNPGGDK